MIIANQQKIRTLEKKFASVDISYNSANALRILPKYIQDLVDSGIPFLELTATGEFVQDGRIYRADIDTYYDITPENAHLFVKKKGMIALVKGEYIFTDEYAFEMKKSFAELKNLFVNILDTSQPFFLSGWAYWWYKYTQYSVFRDDFGMYESDLMHYSIDPKKTLFVQDGEEYYFVKKYDVLRIIDETLLTSITNKDRFLWAAFDDNRFIQGNYDDIFLQIKLQTQTIIRGAKTDREKIQRIYAYLLENLTYYSDFRDGSKRIFSGVYTFQDKQGVCDGFTKLFLYMLSFAKIDDVEIITGYVFDSIDFPEFWHAWVRIGNGYYDPSFDVSFEKNGEKQFFYFDIPRELILTNRFQWLDIPPEFSGLTLSERQELAMQNMHDIYESYQQYDLMNIVRNARIAHKGRVSVSFDEVIKNIGFSEVKNGFLQDKQKKYIFSIKYYPITKENYTRILANPKINLSKSTLLKWYTDDTSFEYRLAYEMLVQ